MVVDDGDFPAGVGGSGGGGGEVAGQGGVEGAEQPVVAGPLGSSLQGGQRGGHLGQHRPAPGSARPVVALVAVAAVVVAWVRAAAWIPAAAWVIVIAWISAIARTAAAWIAVAASGSSSSSPS